MLRNLPFPFIELVLCINTLFEIKANKGVDCFEPKVKSNEAAGTHALKYSCSPSTQPTGAEGLEPPNGGAKNHCLTTWRRPIVHKTDFEPLTFIWTFKLLK